MNEEIDIIELLKRVKEGKAPKRIEIYDSIFIINDEMEDDTTMDTIYYTEKYGQCWGCYLAEIDINTKIKILDKPIIEELEISTDGKSPILIKKDGKTNNLRTIDVEIINKLNEIIKKMNNKENKDE